MAWTTGTIGVVVLALGWLVSGLALGGAGFCVLCGVWVWNYRRCVRRETRH
jgi:hypothetical protein